MQGDRRLGWIGVAVSLLGAVVTIVLNRPWEGSHTRDGAFFAYSASMVEEGLLPYRDLFFLHAPLHPYLTGLAHWVFGSLGLFLVGFAILATTTWAAVCHAQMLMSRERVIPRALAAALIAWGVSTGWPFLGEFLVSGARPKMLAVCLLALAIVALGRQRWWWAGILAGLGCWSWQPLVLPVVGIAIVTSAGVFVLGEKTVRSTVFRGFLRIIGAMAVVSGLMVALLVVTGSFSSFVEQSIRYPIEVRSTFAGAKSSIDLTRWLAAVGYLPLPTQLIGGAGILWFVWLLVVFLKRRTIRSDGTDLVLLALVGWLFAYPISLAMSLEGRGDLLPLLIPLAAFAGAAAADLGRGSAPGLRIGLAAFFCFWLSGGDLLSPLPRSDKVYKSAIRVDGKRIGAIREIAAAEEILVIADPLVQQGLGTKPMHSFVYWEAGSVGHFAKQTHGGLQGFLASLLHQNPRIVVVGWRGAGVMPFLGPRLERRYRLRDDLRPWIHPTFVHPDSEPSEWERVKRSGTVWERR